MGDHAPDLPDDDDDEELTPLSVARSRSQKIG
jgi:hypothetical protein